MCKKQEESYLSKEVRQHHPQSCLDILQGKIFTDCATPHLELGYQARGSTEDPQSS